MHEPRTVCRAAHAGVRLSLARRYLAFCPALALSPTCAAAAPDLARVACRRRSRLNAAAAALALQTTKTKTASHKWRAMDAARRFEEWASRRPMGGAVSRPQWWTSLCRRPPARMIGQCRPPRAA